MLIFVGKTSISLPPHRHGASDQHESTRQTNPLDSTNRTSWCSDVASSSMWRHTREPWQDTHGTPMSTSVDKPWVAQPRTQHEYTMILIATWWRSSLVESHGNNTLPLVTRTRPCDERPPKNRSGETTVACKVDYEAVLQDFVKNIGTESRTSVTSTRRSPGAVMDVASGTDRPNLRASSR